MTAPDSSGTDAKIENSRRDWGTIPSRLALTIVSVLVAVAATFFATRSGLEAKISELQADHEAKISDLRSQVASTAHRSKPKSWRRVTSGS